MPPLTGPKLTVIVSLFNAAGDAAELVEMVLAQRHPHCGERADWFDAVFIDDGSSDATLQILARALAAQGDPRHVRVVANAENLGLSASLNRVLRTCDTDYVVTCQSDCRFGSSTYVAEMEVLLDRHPDAAAITGQPTSGQPIPFEEKINLVENIQDILPRESAERTHESQELIYTGFAEGRADGFRLAAIRAAGYYDTTLRISGEDQVLSGRFRELGYDVYQAPGLTYELSLSSQQDSVGGMLRKQYTWGKTHPYILLRAHETLSGVFGKKAGTNRRLRVLLRLSQVASVAAYVALPAAFLLARPGLGFGILAGLVLMKALIFRKHVRRVRMSVAHLAKFAMLQPLFDVCYSLGLAHGLIALATSASGEHI